MILLQIDNFLKFWDLKKKTEHETVDIFTTFGTKKGLGRDTVGIF